MQSNVCVWGAQMNEQSQNAARPRNLSPVALAVFPSGLLLFTEPLLALVLGAVVHQSSCRFLRHLPESGSRERTSSPWQSTFLPPPLRHSGSRWAPRLQKGAR